MGIPKGKFVDEVIATLGKKAAPKDDQVGEQEEDFDESEFPDSGYHQQVATILKEQAGLSQAMVDRLFDLDMARELSNGEGILMWRDDHGNIVGGSQLFTRTDDTTTTRTARGSKHYYGFNFGYNYTTIKRARLTSSWSLKTRCAPWHTTRCWRRLMILMLIASCPSAVPGPGYQRLITTFKCGASRVTSGCA